MNRNKKINRYIKVNGYLVYIDLLSDSEIELLFSGSSNFTNDRIKPYKVSKNLDGDPEFKGYKVNKYF